MAEPEHQNPADPQWADLTRVLQKGGPMPDALLPLVYSQLRAAAQQRLATERPDHTLQATALVHEAYLKLAGPRDLPWQNRAHFYAAAAEAMRQVLLDHAKARARRKRAGGKITLRIDLDHGATVAVQNTDARPENSPDLEDFVALDAAIRRLAEKDPRTADVVRLKFYAGLEIAQVALVLGVSERTVKNDWAFAKAWLERELRGGGPSRPDERAKERSGEA